MDASAGTLKNVKSNQQLGSLIFLATAAVVITLVLRIIAAQSQPLTMDETFTGMITSQRSFADFIREARKDIAAPLYYTVLWLLPFGSSDFALRLPSWIFMIAASTVPILWRIPGQPQSAAIAWAALLFLWLPGAIFAVQARPYALFFYLSTAQTVAYARLIEAPTLRRSYAWTACTSLTLLCHYFAATLALCQGIALVALLRGRVWKLWPSALLLLVPLVETITHFHLLASFASSDANWLPKISRANLSQYLMFVFGPLGTVQLIIALVSRYRAREGAEPVARGVGFASLTGLLALALLVAAGWHRSLLVERYLTACAPALMLALVTLASGTGARMLTVATSAALAIYVAAFIPLRIGEQSMEWAANKLIPLRPTNVVYSLGYPGQHMLSEETRTKLGAFLFKRAGLQTQAKMVLTLDGRELVRAASPNSAIIWVFYPEWQSVAEAIARERHCFVAPHQLACPPIRS